MIEPLAGLAGVVIGSLLVWWMSERESRRWYQMWAELNMHTLTTEVRSPTIAELKPNTEITCKTEYKGETL